MVSLHSDRNLTNTPLLHLVSKKKPVNFCLFFFLLISNGHHPWKTKAVMCERNRRKQSEVLKLKDEAIPVLKQWLVFYSFPLIAY